MAGAIENKAISASVEVEVDADLDNLIFIMFFRIEVKKWAHRGNIGGNLKSKLS